MTLLLTFDLKLWFKLIFSRRRISGILPIKEFRSRSISKSCLSFAYGGWYIVADCAGITSVLTKSSRLWEAIMIFWGRIISWMFQYLDRSLFSPSYIHYFYFIKKTNVELILKKLFGFYFIFYCILLSSKRNIEDSLVNISLMTSKVPKFLQTHLSKELQAMKDAGTYKA